MKYEIEVAIEKNRVRNKNQYSIIMCRYPPALHWTNMASVAIQWRANETFVENNGIPIENMTAIYGRTYGWHWYCAL
jgi:hypothetical protein